MSKKKHALIVCNALLPPPKLLKAILKKEPLIICADGGANRLAKRGIRADYIIGDLDSLRPHLRAAFASERIIHDSGQDNSDLEKALDFAIDRGIERATVIGATGRRPDHTMANFSILLKYHRKLSLQFIDAYCMVRIIQGKTVLNEKPGTTVSLLPMGRCEGIETEGLAYPLHKESLELGVREGLSNFIVSTPARISISKGYLLLFMVHKK
ncbi:thiamine diphosphokinase [candidate division KSB1 bacterium]|nr:thiamine diphosphokinase [candidate division KSB1 bacterium]